MSDARRSLREALDEKGWCPPWHYHYRIVPPELGPPTAQNCEASECEAEGCPRTESGFPVDPRVRELAEDIARERSLTLDEAREAVWGPLRDAGEKLGEFTRSQAEHASDRRTMYEEGLYRVPTSLGMLPGYTKEER